jgi:regulator of replication initiation timing
MFWWSSKNKIKELEQKTENAFSSVKNDMDAVGKWVKHLDSNDKQLFDLIYSLRQDLATLNEEVAAMKEGFEMAVEEQRNKQVFKKLPVLSKQTSVEDVQKTVQKTVQTAVQTDNIYGILKNLSGNERLVVFTLLNSEMKLSYEDIALLLGKERSTIRGQINAIKQKAEGLVQEIVESNGKKRVFIPEEIKSKLQKYAKSRMGKKEEKE